MNQFDVAMFVLRLVFGCFLAYHGLNKVRGGLAGTATWFASIGMKWPLWQARLAATTEIGAGLMFAAGLLTPLAAAGMVAVMLVAIRVDHWTNGFFIFNKNQGWEYCASIAVVAFCVATVGAGRWSVDHALGVTWHGWAGAIIAGTLGLSGAVLQLTLSYRPNRKPGAPT